MVENYANPVLLKRYDFILKQISDYAKGNKINILDIGCGVGNLTYPLAKLGHEVVGIDNDEGLIIQCIGNNHYQNAFFLVRDAQKLDGFGQFDVVICIEVLEHTANPKQVVEGINKVLKPNGILILTVPNGYCPLEIVMNRILNRKGKSTWALKMIRPFYGLVTGTKVSRIHPFYIDSPHLQFFSMRQIRKLFSNYKIEVFKHADLGIFIPGSGRLAWLKKIECNIADKLPHFMVGGWMFVLRKND